MLHFVTQHYHPCSPVKAKQLREALEFNLGLDIFDKVTLLLEDNADFSDFPSVSTKLLGRRALFSDFLELITEQADESSHIVFSNSDMMMSADILKAIDRVTMHNSVLALTRRELDGSLPSIDNPSWSQDTWVMKSHKISSMLIETVRHSLGIAGCENLFAAQLVANGYNLWNPSLDVLTIHNDPSPTLTYSRDRRYNGFFAIPHLCHLLDIESTIPGYEFTFCVKS
jgi:hypothetical protein